MPISLLAFYTQKNTLKTSKDIPDGAYMGKSDSLKFCDFKSAFKTIIYFFAGLKALKKKIDFAF